MGLGNLGRRLVLGGELEQDSPVDKAVAGGEEQCSPVDKAAEAAAEEGNALKDGLRRLVAIGSLP